MYVSVPAEKFAEVFTKAGFTSTVVHNEVVYERAHTNPSFRVRVYTSLSVGAASTREVGSDAIRACLVRVANGVVVGGAGKTTRVNRTGTVDGVMERTLERAREMWNLASRWSRPQAPAYTRA